MFLKLTDTLKNSSSHKYIVQGSAHLKIFLDRIGIGSVALIFFWIGSGSDRSPQIFFGSDRDRIGRLKFFLDRIGIGSVRSKCFWIGSGSDRLAQKKIGSDRDRIGIGSVFLKSRFPHIVNRENILKRLKFCMGTLFYSKIRTPAVELMPISRAGASSF